MQHHEPDCQVEICCCCFYLQDQGYSEGSYGQNMTLSSIFSELNNDKTEALLLRSSSRSFSDCKPTTISVVVKYLFLLLLEILVFTSEMT